MRRLILTLILALAASASAFSSTVPAPDTTEPGTAVSEDLVLKYCKWYVSTPPSTDPAEIEARKAIGALIVTYVCDTKKFSIQLGGAAAKMLGLNDPDHDADLLGVYLAGETIYCLEHDLKVSDATSFANAMADVVNFYSMLPEHNVKSLDKYLDMDNSERIKRFEKFYNDNSSD